MKKIAIIFCIILPCTQIFAQGKKRRAEAFAQLKTELEGEKSLTIAQLKAMGATDNRMNLRDRQLEAWLVLHDMHISINKVSITLLAWSYGLETVIRWEIVEEEQKATGIFESAFEQANLRWKNVYSRDLKFETTPLYAEMFGYKCGYSGITPIKGKEMQQAILSQDTSKLTEWLYSTTLAKQAYAVVGLTKLNKMGVSLSEESQKLIDYIQNKPVIIFVCNGCIPETYTMKVAIEKYGSLLVSE